MNIKLFVPRLVWSHNRTELQTLLNITFWPKTELRTCRISQKTKQFVNIELFIPRLHFIVPFQHWNLFLHKGGCTRWFFLITTDEKKIGLYFYVINILSIFSSSILNLKLTEPFVCVLKLNIETPKPRPLIAKNHCYNNNFQRLL